MRVCHRWQLRRAAFNYHEIRKWTRGPYGGPVDARGERAGRRGHGRRKKSFAQRPRWGRGRAPAVRTPLKAVFIVVTWILSLNGGIKWDIPSGILCTSRVQRVSGDDASEIFTNEYGTLYSRLHSGWIQAINTAESDDWRYPILDWSVQLFTVVRFGRDKGQKDRESKRPITKTCHSTFRYNYFHGRRTSRISESFRFKCNLQPIVLGSDVRIVVESEVREIIVRKLK